MTQSELSPIARRMLTVAARATDSSKGSIVVSRNEVGVGFIIAGGDDMMNELDKQTQELWLDALAELLKGGLVREVSRDSYTLTTAGYTLAASVSSPR